jgi:hypothetical protein
MTRFERAKYAGELAATKFPDLAGRFQFWCGGSGRRYATSRYLPDRTPAYDLAVSLYVKQTNDGPKVIAIAAGAANQPAPDQADEIHVHVVERVEALAFAHHDLRVLIESETVPGNAPDGAPDNIVPFNPRRAA